MINLLRYKEIKQQLTAVIISMLPKEPLPSREALCKSLDTTRSTLDKAIKELVAEGKLVTKGGSGTYIAGEKEEEGTVRTIGLLLPNNMHTSYRNLISGIEAYMHSKGVNLILCCTDGSVEKQNQYLSRLLLSNISGLIIVPAFCLDITKDYVLYSRLMQHNVPVIFCFRGIDGLNNAPLICYNNFYGGYIATKHLISRGYRHIGFIAQYMLRTSLDRYQGYVAAMVENGLEINKQAVVFETVVDDLPHGYTNMRQILSTQVPLDAVFCHADCLVPAVYQAIRDAGKTVSDDIGIISFDDDDTCIAETPRITSLGGKDTDIGTKAAETLWKMMHGEQVHVPYFLVQPEIAIRESCLGPVNT